jgi:hypothetical protein
MFVHTASEFTAPAALVSEVIITSRHHHPCCDCTVVQTYMPTDTSSCLLQYWYMLNTL